MISDYYANSLAEAERITFSIFLDALIHVDMVSFCFSEIWEISNKCVRFRTRKIQLLENGERAGSVPIEKEGNRDNNSQELGEELSGGAALNMVCQQTNHSVAVVVRNVLQLDVRKAIKVTRC